MYQHCKLNVFSLQLFDSIFGQSNLPCILNGWLHQLKNPSMVLNTLGTKGFFSCATRSFNRVSATGRQVFGWRLKKLAAKPQEKTSGAEHLDLLFHWFTRGTLTLPRLFKRWIALSTGEKSIQWTVQLVCLILIRWIVIYPVDSAIQRLNNWGQK